MLARLLVYLSFAQTSKLYSFSTPSQIFFFEFLFSTRAVILIYTRCYFVYFLLSFSVKIFSSFIIFIFPYNIIFFFLSNFKKMYLALKVAIWAFPLWIFTFIIDWGAGNFFCKGLDSNFFQIWRPHNISQFCHRNVKAAIDSMYMNEFGYVPKKCYLQKQATGWI